jgi:hypothetical protein
MNGIPERRRVEAAAPLPHTDVSLRQIPNATFALVTQATAFSCTAQLNAAAAPPISPMNPRGAPQRESRAIVVRITVTL